MRMGWGRSFGWAVLLMVSAGVATAAPGAIAPPQLSIGSIRVGTAEAVVRRLGSPLRVTTEPHPNYSKVQRLMFAGLTVLVADGYVTLVHTQDRRFATIDGVRVGDPKAKVLQIYGPAAESTDGRRQVLRYTNDAQAAYLVFVLEGDRVKHITCGTLMD